MSLDRDVNLTDKKPINYIAAKSGSYSFQPMRPASAAG